MTVFYQIPESSTVIRPRWTSPAFTTLGDFKKIAATAINEIGDRNLPPDNRKVKAANVVAVLAYSWVRGVSIDHAAERLDDFAITEGSHAPHVFADGRQSRAYPHQTSVNEWLRELDLPAARRLCKAVFGAALRLARERKLLPRQVVIEYDLTPHGYWGRRRDPLIKGSTLVEGTRFIRHYHAAMIHGGGVSLYVALDHVAKSQSKVPFLLETARWLKTLGFNVKWALADREYYRHGVLAGLKREGIDVITPAKDYPQMRAAKEDFLLGRKGRVQAFQLGTKNKKGARTLYAACWVVICPVKGAGPLDAIVAEVRQQKMTLDEAAAKLFGLLTTAAPQGHGRGFPRLILRLYRMRWQIETGFREMEVKHSPWRSEHDGTRLVDELGRAMLHNAWQLARKADPRGDDLTFQTFRDEVVDAATNRMNL
jgi:hypothetical protein